MSADLLISLAVFGGTILLSGFGGFILGRLTCSCRKEVQRIKQYLHEIGADKSEDVRPNVHLWDPLEIPKDDDTRPLPKGEEMNCGDCIHCTEFEGDFEGQDIPAWCVAMKCQTSQNTKVLWSAPCTKTGRKLFEERING